MQLQLLLTDYLKFLKHEQGATATTCKTYHASLYHFHRWMIENGYAEPALADVTTPLLRRYLYALSERGIRPRTIRGYFIPLRSFGEWLLANELLATNPAKAITLPKRDAAQRQVTTDEEVLALLDACERDKHTPELDSQIRIKRLSLDQKPDRLESLAAVIANLQSKGILPKSEVETMLQPFDSLIEAAQRLELPVGETMQLTAYATANDLNFVVQAAVHRVRAGWTSDRWAQRRGAETALETLKECAAYLAQKAQSGAVVRT